MGHGSGGRGRSEGSGRRTWALTEQQDDTGQHDDQGAQADARGLCPQRSGTLQADAVLATVAYGHIKELLATLRWLP